MTDIPILFSARLIRAWLAGKKSMTRRLAWTKASIPRASLGLTRSPWCNVKPGDRLWVRECFSPDYFGAGAPAYRADWSAGAADVCHEPKWKPSIHMPRKASRMTLIVGSVKIEPLHEISLEDVIAEGIEPSAPIGAFPELWDRLHGTGAWAKNPEVVAIGGAMIFANIDTLSPRPLMKPETPDPDFREVEAVA